MPMRKSAARSHSASSSPLFCVPDSVLSLARDKLTQLETGKIQLETVAPPAQNDFFLAPDTHPVIEKLQGLNLDDLSPRAALELLYELRKQL